MYGTMEILIIILVFDIKTYGVSLISKHPCVEISEHQTSDNLIGDNGILL